MIRRFCLLGVLLGLAVPAGLIADPGDAVDLSPLWKTGQKSRYQVEQTELTTLSAPGAGGGERQSLTEFSAEAAWEVLKAAPGGGGTARFTLNKIRMSITGADGQRSEVSGSRADDRLKSVQQWIRALEGAPIEVDISSDAQVGRARGFQAVQTRAGELGDSLDEDYFREIAMELALLVGGPARATPGRSWTHRYSGERRGSPPGRMEYDSRFELKSVELLADIPVAAVERQTRMRYTPTLPEIPADVPLQISINLADQSSQAQLLFDTSRRELVGAHYDQTLNFRMTRSFNGQGATVHITERVVTQILRTAEE